MDKIISISINLLDGDPRNPNICTQETLEKLKNNIKEVGSYIPLCVRPNPEDPERFIIIDGHHRKIVLEALGHTKVLCQVFQGSGGHVQVLLASLNRLRGVDNPRKRAELLDSLLGIYSPEDLSLLVPESPEGMKDFLSLLTFDENDLELRLLRQTQEEVASQPVSFAFLVAAEDAPTVEKALALFQRKSSKKKDKAEALVDLCRKVLGENHEI